MKENLDAAKSIIDSISKNIWNSIFNTLVIYACWLTAIYLISPDFYNHSPAFIYFIIGFALSAQWFVASFILAAILGMLETKRRVEQNNTVPLNHGLYADAVAALYSLTVLGLSTLIWYGMHWQFRYLVIVIFALTYLSVVLIIALTSPDPEPKG